ncbi:NTP/NDP exchange transporter [Novipirellula aureliae]|nr:MFS transporter [Novipirellula aureliae]
MTKTPPTNPRFLSRWAIDISANERASVAWAFAWFFCILLSYFMLRPIRDAMGIEGGTKQLPHLFLMTFLAMLVAVPIYSALVSRLPRRWLVRTVYHFFAICLLMFWGMMQFESDWLIIWTARVVFIWINVFALFATSVFWSVLADLFASQQGKRLFGLIAAGGTSGAITGSLLTTFAAPYLETRSLLLVSAVLIEIGLACAWRLEKNAPRLAAANPIQWEDPLPGKPSGTRGGILSGIAEVGKSSYLAMICLFLLFVQLLGTQLYFQQAHIVEGSIDSTADRIQLFASLDLGSQLFTLVMQTVVAGIVLRKLGTQFALVLLPIVYIVGFLLLARDPSLGVLVVLVVVSRGCGYGITVPAREVLFTVVSKEQKYKSKNFIDTVVLRGGDAIAGQVFRGLQGIGVSLSALNYYAIPVAAIWGLVAWRLGKRQEKLARRRRTSS